MISDRLIYLFKQSASQQARPEEMEELYQLLQAEENELEVTDLFKRELQLGSGLVQVPEDKRSIILQSIFDAAKFKQLSGEPNYISTAPVHRIHFLRRGWFRYAAAVMLLLAGIGVWQYVSRSARNDVATTNNNIPLQTDIAPGGDRALLTLADGSTIVLDSAANGNLTQQGNTKIIKLSNGQLAYYTGNDLTKEVLYNTISTPRGGQYQIDLPDGSKLWLNAASSIKFPAAFTGLKRNVEVTGEVYMEIAKNSKQPFIVTTRGSEIQVLGTSFNVNSYADEGAIKTTLVEGSVKVGQVILKPGQQAVQPLNATTAVISSDQPSKVISVDINQALAWKNRIFNFNGLDFESVIRQLERWYDIKVHYQNAIPTIIFKGEMYRSVNLSSVLRLLKESGVQCELNGKILEVF